MLGLPEGPWSDADRLLATALQRHEDTLCSCGHPVDRAFDPRTEGEFEVEEHECQACAARDRHDAEQRDREKRPRPGAKVIVRDVGSG